MEVFDIVLKRLSEIDVKKWGLRAFVVLIVVLSIGIPVSIYTRVQHVAQERVTELGERAVKLMYDFGTVEQLDYQMNDLKAITTDAVFNQLTIDNEERTLNTYLKFKNETVTVDIVRSTNNYVMYHLITTNISAERLFVFFFEVDDSGKICYVREVEAIDFVDSAN